MVDSENPATGDMWKRIGFMRHAGEFWLLAHVIVNRISGLNAQQPETSAIPSQGSSMHLDCGPSDPILNKYDETSMRQVNDLIADFHKVHLH